jgi:hypothetical protein
MRACAQQQKKQQQQQQQQPKSVRWLPFEQGFKCPSHIIDIIYMMRAGTKTEGAQH